MQLLNLLVPVLTLTEDVIPSLRGPIGQELTNIKNLDAAGQKVVAAVTPVVPAGAPQTFLQGASAIMGEIASTLEGLMAIPTSGTAATVSTIAAALTTALQELWANSPTLADGPVKASVIPGLVSGLAGLYSLLTTV